MSSNRLSQNSPASGVSKPGLAFLVMIFIALLAFEIFNYSTTELALKDLLGDLTFMGLRWSTVLALAFGGIDFAGIARLFTPEHDQDEPKEVWYLFGAWLLAATMNAILTWWGVSMAVINHNLESSAVVDPKTITTVVPVFVAVMVWVIRILIIGTLSQALDRMISQSDQPASRPAQNAFQRMQQQAGVHPNAIPGSLGSAATSLTRQPIRPTRPAATPMRAASPANRKTQIDEAEPEQRMRLEPTYHSLSAAPANNRANNQGGSLAASQRRGGSL